MRLLFTGRWQVTPDIVSFTFRPEVPVSWLAGQSIRLELPAPDYGTNERRFTISSAPFERDITVTTRLSDSEFKQSLFGLEPGAVVDGYGIQGDFVWRGERPVWVASGIGITPFYSMLKQRLHDTGMANVTLMYGGNSGQLAFVPELMAWQRVRPEFGLRLLDRPLDAAVLDGQDLVGRQIYISGSERLVQQLRQDFIARNGLDASQIQTDLFTGQVP